MTVAFYTLGCKVNSYETEALQKMFEADGFEVVSHKAYADVYIINTCTVTNTSDAKSRKAIRQAVKRNPDAVVAVIGCYSQVESEVVAAIEGVDIIMGTSERERLLVLVKRFLRERKQIMAVQDITRYKAFDQLNVTSFSENTRAFIKIQDGCNQYCSFCIIPFARGPVRSRPKDAIIKEAEALINKGYKEIVLTGIHTGGYGQDTDTESFYDLLEHLSRLKHLARLRISSIEINQLTDDILTLISTRQVFARHLHIPLQSGSDKILKAMGRRYSLSAFETMIKKIRTLMPDVAITTDVIVGYPEESDADFETIQATIKRLAFFEMHVFPYSKRSGTKAAQVKDQVHGTLKSMRVNTLLKLNEALALDYIQSLEATNHQVLFEKCDGEHCYGHSAHYIRFKVKTTEHLENQMYTLKMVKPDYPESLGIINDEIGSIG